MRSYIKNYQQLKNCMKNAAEDYLESVKHLSFFSADFFRCGKVGRRRAHNVIFCIEKLDQLSFLALFDALMLTSSDKLANRVMQYMAKEIKGRFIRTIAYNEKTLVENTLESEIFHWDEKDIYVAFGNRSRGDMRAEHSKQHFINKMFGYRDGVKLEPPSSYILIFRLVYKEIAEILCPSVSEFTKFKNLAQGFLKTLDIETYTDKNFYVLHPEITQVVDDEKEMELISLNG